MSELLWKCIEIGFGVTLGIGLAILLIILILLGLAKLFE